MNNELRSSIRKKLIVLLMLAAIVPFGVSILFNYQHTSRSVREQTLQENVKLLSAGQRNVDSYLKRIDQLGLTLYNKASSNGLFRRSAQEDGDFNAKVKDMLLTILSASPNVERVDWRFFGIGRTFTLTPSLWKQTKLPPGEASLSAALLQDPYRGRFSVPDGRSLVYERAFIDIPGSDALGSLTIAIDRRELEDLARDLFVRGDSEFYVFDPEGRALFRSVPGEEGKSELRPQDADAPSGWYSQVKADSRQSGYEESYEDGFRGITLFTKLAGTNEGWMLVKRIPFEVLNRNAREIVRINVQIGALALVLAVVATMAVSFRITSPLRILIRNIRHIKKGNLQVDYDSLGNDEIGVVGDQFKSMVETIRSLMIKEYNLEIQNKTQQLNALQAQLNPHFLNNALQSTAALAYENEDFEVYRLIRSLSKMMRYSMNFEEELVPLERELGHVRAYLELQRHRFEERLRVELETDGACDDWLVPKMTIQPLVENYFKHAFDAQTGEGRLRIRASLEKSGDGVDPSGSSVMDKGDGTGEDKGKKMGLGTIPVNGGGMRNGGDAGEKGEVAGNGNGNGNGDAGRLSIVVEDNGKGMEAGELAALLRAAERPTEQGEPYGKVGLANLIRRIRLYYGDSAEIRLANREDGGFRVRLLLPRHIPQRDSSMRIGNGGIEA